MIDSQQDREPEEQRSSSTGPPEDKTHEATTPPGQGELDEDAVRKGEEALDQAGGGH